MTAPDGDQVVVGSVAVEVVANARRFARSLKREVQESFKGIGKTLQTQLNKELRGDGRRSGVQIRVRIDDAQVQREARRALTTVRRVVRDAGPVRMRVQIPDKLAEREGRRAARLASKAAGPVRLNVQVSDRQAAAAGRKASQGAQGAAGPIQLPVKVDRKQLRKVLAGALAGVKIGGLVAVGLPAVAALVQGVSALVAGLAAAAAGAVPVIGALVDVLVTAAGAAVAIPGAIAVAGVAFAALKVGLSGVGDALKAVTKDSAEFEEAIKNLAPAAQEFLRTLRDMRPVFRELRLNTQQALFEGLSDAVRDLAEAHLPTLRSRFDAIATSINSGLLVAIGRLTTEQAKLDIRSIFTDAANAVANLTQAFGPLVDIMRDVATVGATVAAELTRGVGLAVADFAGQIAEMRQSGELRQIILDGLDALKLLGSALVDVVGIFRGLFRAAGEGGGGIFAFLDRLNILVNSFAGQEALGNLFAELGRIGEALMPVLLALGQGLGVVAQAVADIAVAGAPFLAEGIGFLAEALASLAPGIIALGPSVVALAQGLVPLGQILSDLVVGLAPGIEAFLLALGEGLEFLAPVASTVGEALGDLLTAVAPLLPVLGAALANALTELAVIVDAVANGPLMVLIGVFSQLATEFASQLLPILVQLATDLFPILAEAGGQVLEAFGPLVPVVAGLAETVAGKLAAAMPDLVEAFSRLALALADVGVEVAEALVDALIQLAPQLPQLADAGIALALALADLAVSLVPLIPLLGDLLEAAAGLANPQTLGALTILIRAFAGSIKTLALILPAIVNPLGGIVNMLSGVDWAGIGSAIAGAFATAWQAVSGFFVNLAMWFRDLPGQIIAFLAPLPGQVGRVFLDTLNQALYWVGFGIGKVLRFFIDLPGKVVGFISTLPTRAAVIWNSTMDEAREIVSKGVDAVVGFFTGLPDRARGGVSSLWSRISGAFSTAVSNVRTKAGELVNGFINVVRDLPGRARDQAVRVKDRIISAFAGAASWLYQAGRDILRGLANGIRGAIGSAVDAAVDAARSVVDGVKDGLGIGSPSKVFRDEVGRWIPEGIAEGIRRSAGSPQAAMDDVVARFRNRFDPAVAIDAANAQLATALQPPAPGASALSDEERELLRALVDRPIELRTSDEVIARSSDRGQRVLARRR